MLLAGFGGLMIVVGLVMLCGRSGEGDPLVRLTAGSARILLPRLVGLGAAVGLLSGFFGIGGGFLIVPALILATGMPIGLAIGTSLVLVTALGAMVVAIGAFVGLRAL